jgi:hypothetical protein
MFIYFCIRSYKEYGVKIFLTDELNDRYKPIIQELKTIGDVVIQEKCFSAYPKSNQELKTLRWIVTQRNFTEYDNIYIGDVDILICKENPSLELQHINHCEEINLPYSNIVRPYSANRLSGLHFIKKEEYYKALSSIINKYSRLLKNNKLKNIKNEETLYNMIKESELDFPSKYFWPHHGIHLGWWRKGYRMVSKKRWHQIGLKNDYKNYLKFFRKIEQENLYKKVYEVAPLEEIKFMKKALSKEFNDTA